MGYCVCSVLELIAFVTHPSYDYMRITILFFQCSFKCKMLTYGCAWALQERNMPLGIVGGQGRSKYYLLAQDTIVSNPVIMGWLRRAFGSLGELSWALMALI